MTSQMLGAAMDSYGVCPSMSVAKEPISKVYKQENFDPRSFMHSLGVVAEFGA